MGAWLEAAVPPVGGAAPPKVTLVAQDWGGLIGLRLVAARPDRFARVVIANTGLPAGLVPRPLCAALRRALATSLEPPPSMREVRREGGSSACSALARRKRGGGRGHSQDRGVAV